MEIYDVTVWLTNNCNTHIAQYFTNQRQQDNESWSVNRILQEKHLSSKIIQKMRRGDSFQTCFCFLKKALDKVKARDLLLGFTIFEKSQISIVKTKCIKL